MIQDKTLELFRYKSLIKGELHLVAEGTVERLNLPNNAHLAKIGKVLTLGRLDSPELSVAKSIQGANIDAPLQD